MSYRLTIPFSIGFCWSLSDCPCIWQDVFVSSKIMPPQAKQCYPNHKEGSEYSNAGHVKALGSNFMYWKKNRKDLWSTRLFRSTSQFSRVCKFRVRGFRSTFSPGLVVFPLLFNSTLYLLGMIICICLLGILKYLYSIYFYFYFYCLSNKKFKYL